MAFIDVNVQRAFNELTGQKTTLEEININDVLPELKRLGLAEEPLSIQDHFIQRWYYLRKHYIGIESWQKIGHEVRYLFKLDNHTAGFKYWVNGQNAFNPNFQKLPAQTNSDELFEKISKIIEKPDPVVVIRNNVEGILNQIEFDIAIEEEKPFLRNLFDHITMGLDTNEVITKIQHIAYRERYTIEKKGSHCVIDFEYDSAGFFGRVLPLENQCNNPDLIAKVKAIVNNLKEATYVV